MSTRRRKEYPEQRRARLARERPEATALAVAWAKVRAHRSDIVPIGVVLKEVYRPRYETFASLKAAFPVDNANAVPTHDLFGKRLP